MDGLTKIVREGRAGKTEPVRPQSGRKIGPMTLAQWSSAVKDVAARIESERSTIGHLEAGEFAIDDIIYRTRLLEELVNDYLKLRIMGKKMGFERVAGPW